MREQTRPGKSRERCKFYHLSLLPSSYANSIHQLANSPPTPIPAPAPALHRCHLMRISLVGLVTLLALLIGVSPALAQRRTAIRRAPATGMVGVGASVGIDLPSDPALAKGPDLAANIEGYLTPRVSVRGQLGGA